MKTNKINITGIGADIEVFLKEKETNKIISAEGFIQGSKYNPHFFDKENHFFSTSLDNVLAEFTIPPATSPEDFLNFVKKGLSYIDNTIPQNLCTAAVPAALLDDEYLFTENAMLFGCEPDFNAYTGRMNVKEGMPDYRLRSGGGHIHIGYANAPVYDEDNYKVDEERSSIIKALDLFIGVPSVIMEPDNQRKELYGTAGSFRPKTYGVEYRTVSNYYLETDNLIKWVYNSARKAIDWMNGGNVLQKKDEKAVQSCINNNDKNLAQTLIQSFNLDLA